MQKPSEDSQPPKRWLEAEDFQYLCFDLARELMSYGEPIPDYSTRDENLLSAALGAPRQTFGGAMLYPDLPEQASILLYTLIKNHPFRNGNKRIAVMTLLAFLSINDRWIDIDPIKLYEIATEVSKSKPADREKVFKTLVDLISKGLIE